MHLELIPSIHFLCASIEVDLHQDCSRYLHPRCCLYHYLPRFDVYLILLGFRSPSWPSLQSDCRTLLFIPSCKYLYSSVSFSVHPCMLLCISAYRISSNYCFYNFFLWHYVLVLASSLKLLSICCLHSLLELSASLVVFISYNVCFVSALTLIVFCCSLQNISSFHLSIACS